MNSKIVLISRSGYSKDHDTLLKELIESGIELFCAVGIDCEKWEEAMDWICVELDANNINPGVCCTTTSHPDESIEDAIFFAENWSGEKNGKVEIIEI